MSKEIMDVPDFMKSRMKKQRFPLPLRIAAVVVVVILVGMGTWQIACSLRPDEDPLESKARYYVNKMGDKNQFLYKTRPDCSVVEVIQNSKISYFIFDKDSNLLYPASISASSLVEKANGQ